MDLHQLADLIYKLRVAQKNYFRTRENRYLLESKQWEKDVDREVKAILFPDTQEKMELK